MRVGLLLVAVACARAAGADNSIDKAPCRPGDLRSATDVARALALTVDRVCDAERVPLSRAPGTPAVIVARYRPRDSRWAFPVLGVYHTCQRGTGSCISVVHLGSAHQKRVRVARLVDLNAPSTVVDGLTEARRGVAEPEETARRPALLVVGTSDEGEQRDEVTIVSLESPRPERMLTASVAELQRVAQPHERMPVQRYLGFSSSLTFARAGDEHTLVFLDRGHYTPDSRCYYQKANPPGERRFRLDGRHYVSTTNKPVDPCY